jgi:hypothetical protein
MSATTRTFHCLTKGGDKEDLHFEFSDYRSEEVAEQDGRELGNWLSQNLSADAYLGMIDELKKHVWECMERAVKGKVSASTYQEATTEFFKKRAEGENKN